MRLTIVIPSTFRVALVSVSIITFADFFQYSSLFLLVIGILPMQIRVSFQPFT